MAADDYNTVENCSWCPCRSAEVEHQRQLKLFPSAELLELIIVNIPGILKRTKPGNKLVVAVTGRHRKLTRVIPINETTSTQVGQIYFDNWVIPFFIKDVNLSDNGQCFQNELSTSFSTYLRVNKLTTTAVRPQTNSYVERYNEIWLSRLGPCIVN